MRCLTCGGNDRECQGHFGHLELATPIFHVGFTKVVLAVLRMTCYSCSHILADKSSEAFQAANRIRNGKKKMKKMLSVAKLRTCSNCAARQPAYSLETHYKFSANFKKHKDKEYEDDEDDDTDGKKEVTGEFVHRILRAISNEDLRSMGLDPEYARPDWMVMTVFPIPPPAVRPSVRMEGTGGRSEDDLTHQLAQIIRANNQLARQLENGAPNHIVKEFTALLQHYIATYIDNTLPGLPASTVRSGRPIKSISQRLKGKEGRVRGNLMGKRVDFSARTVITPDPNIGIDELGVPRSIANNMTIPEVVTPYNYERLVQIVAEGPMPNSGKTGAKAIIREDGVRVDLRYTDRPSDFHLEMGYKVERTLEDGDYVLFNRQPSLHKMSMMGHRVRIMPYSTFRLNLSVTSPYNADFDGDEMNMHVPQTAQARAEIKELMMVPKMIVSPQANKPVIGIVQDTLLGCRTITKRDTFIKKDVFFNIIMWLEEWDGIIPTPAILKPEPLWTGKQVFDLFLPMVNLRRKSAWHVDGEVEDLSPADTQVLIRNGKLVTGTLCKKTLGTSSGSLIHVIWEERGPDAARAFINQTQTLVNYWLLQTGFSIGIGDTVADGSTMQKIDEIISTAKTNVQTLIGKSQRHELEAQPGRTMIESFESLVNQELNKARDTAGNTAQKSLPEMNNVKQMVTAGSKGSFINISQMTACVGQQNVEGKRIPFGFVDRTLPHFTKTDVGPESRGFVQNSYLSGLTPEEFYFHAMGGREGLIDTAVKTSETGYIQRRLVKAMEDIKVQYDGTVRNSSGSIIQFLYGEDGMEACYIESQKLDHLRSNTAQLENMFKFEYDRFQWSPDYLDQEIVRTLQTSEEAQNELKSEFSMILDDLHVLRTEVLTSGDAMKPLPTNIDRLIQNAKAKFHSKLVKELLTPSYIINRVREVTDKMKVVSGSDPISTEAQKNATLLFFSLIRCKLASKRVLREYKLSKEGFDFVIGELESRFTQALVQPCEMIGTIAAQSIGEPATQMTLNTFHYAGVSAKNVTLGVPRLKEIINISKNIKTPSLSVHLTGSAATDRDEAKRIQSLLEYTTLRNVTQYYEIHYDPDPTKTVIREDVEFVRSFYELPDEDVDPSTLSPWLLRIVLDREMMVDKNLSMASIGQKFDDEYADDFKCIFTDDNAENLVLRIRLVNDKTAMIDDDEEEGGNAAAAGGGGSGATTALTSDEDTFLKRFANQLLDEKLKGVDNIKKVFIREAKKTTLDYSGTLPEYKQEKEWLLDTEGINLKQVMRFEGVDHTRVFSNDLNEVMQVLGIEAARNILLKELRGVIEFDGSYVNHRHLSILCDAMTSRGHFMSITRHGINRSPDNGPLMRCSFEETVDILNDAAAFGELDTCRGVSQKVMLGQLAPIGTGSFDVVLDQSSVANAVEFAQALYPGGGYGAAGGDFMQTPGRGQTPGGANLLTASPGLQSSPYQPSPLLQGDGTTFMTPLRQAGGSRRGGVVPPTAAAAAAAGTTQFSPLSPAYSPSSPGIRYVLCFFLFFSSLHINTFWTT